MLSRTADHLYWMSRYIERAESTRAHGRRALPHVAAARPPEAGRNAEARP